MEPCRGTGKSGICSENQLRVCLQKGDKKNRPCCQRKAQEMIEQEEMPRGGVPLGHRTADYWFDLPQELIAQDPLEDRSSSRLLVLDKKTGARKHGTFRDILQYLEPVDAMILNDTKVIPARLLGQREEPGQRSRSCS